MIWFVLYLVGATAFFIFEVSEHEPQRGDEIGVTIVAAILWPLVIVIAAYECIAEGRKR